MPKRNREDSEEVFDKRTCLSVSECPVNAHKRKVEDEEVIRNIRPRLHGSFHVTPQEYRQMILALCRQNKRLLERATTAEDKYNDLAQNVQTSAFNSRLLPVCSAIGFSPTLIK